MRNNIVIFIAGIIAGMIIAYGYMWYQVYHQLDSVICQMTRSGTSIHSDDSCK